MLTLSLFNLELILSSLWTKAAIPTGLILTDFENAIQVTARSKNPIPMTCSVFSVTESQMRTFGGNCCLENNAGSPIVSSLQIYLYLEIMRLMLSKKNFFLMHLRTLPFNINKTFPISPRGRSSWGQFNLRRGLPSFKF